MELYNLKDDISESNNLAESHIEKRQELMEELVDWWQNTNAPIPSQINPLYEPHQPHSHSL